MVARLAVALAVGLLLAFVPPTSADHAQPAQGDVLVFDHKTGNEWWVEVVLSGGASGSVSGVQAMDTGGGWVTLTKRDWGAWAASFHIEPGHQVKFRANWSGGDLLESCWFEHPSGVERCPTQPAWESRLMGDSGDAFAQTDIAVGDGNDDGQREVYVPMSDRVQVFVWTPEGWSDSMAFGHGRAYTAIAVGDANNDGHPEVWASSANEVFMFEWDGGSWLERVSLTTSPTFSVTAMSLGDVDDDGLLELYVGHGGTNSDVQQVTLSDYTPTVLLLARMDYGTRSVWVGDADASGDLELLVASSFRGVGQVHVLDVDADGNAQATRTHDNSDPGAGVTGVVAGSIGLGPETYFTEGHEVLRSRWTGTAWSTTSIATLPQLAIDLFLGDGDNDGKAELYASTSFESTGSSSEPGQLYQIAWDGSWTTHDLGAVGGGPAFTFVIGDGDNDGKREAYVVAQLTQSCCTSGVYQVSDHEPPTYPGGWTATFTGFRGNEWWVQANVGSDGPAIAKVDVRITPEGPWKPLAKQSWGPTAWAASYHFPPGSILQMQATASDGQVDLSRCRQWIPPSGQDASVVDCPDRTPPPPPGFDATWSNVKGNEWWVEAVVEANAPVQGVLLMIDCDTQHDPYDMTHKPDWGKWVLGSIHVPTGSVITMTAVGPDGATDTSATYHWPQATVAKDCPEPWPQDSSHADVRFRHELREYDGEGGERYTMWDGLVHTEWTSGQGIDETTFDGNAFWNGTCTQRVTHMDWDGTWSNVTETYEWDRAPPTGVVPAQTGDTVDVETIGGGCEPFTSQATVLGKERRTFSMKDSSGDLIEVNAYRAGNSDTGFFEDYWYDDRLGLIVSWHTHSSSAHHISTHRGWLLDTDAGFY